MCPDGIADGQLCVALKTPLPPQTAAGTDAVLDPENGHVRIAY
jgi:hypothetical protein